MNYSDSERIAGFLTSKKFKPTQNINEAKLIIFNTCGVRQMAEDRVYGQIHNLKKQELTSKEQKIIILTGCLANRPDVKRRLKNKVDLFTSIKDFPNNFQKLLNIKYPVKLRHEVSKISNTSENISDYFHINPEITNKHQALVPIMTGCNNFCAYCVVPYARGRETSRPADEIISEIRKLVKDGTKHIILLGQNVNSYASQFYKFNKIHKEINFSKLLQKINAIPGKFWITFVSSHPKDVTNEMVEMVAKCKKVCENFHLPIQAGNDEVLKNMNRKYTQKQYLQKIRKIKTAFKKYKPNAPFSLTSDIIVGFPGETKNQFSDSAEVMRKAEYDMVYFGQFSPRPQTTAWKMKDNISKKEKQRRHQYLNEILKKTCLKNNKKYVGKVLEVLVEEFKTETYFGKTRTMKNVKIISNKKNLVGKIVKVKIIKANIWNLEGVYHPTGGRP